MKSFLFFILFIPLLAFPQTGASQWDFPVKPGSEKWRSLKNNAEKVEACQVPDEVLSASNTQKLLDICLNYPLLPDIFAFNSVKDGFGKFESDFNGFRELLKREDVPKELLKKYKSIQPEAIPANGTILGKGNYVLSMSFIELFVSHPLIVEKIDTSTKKEIINELLAKKEKKKQQPDWYQTTGIQTNYLAIVTMIQSESNKIQLALDTVKVFPFIYSGILLNQNITNQIDQATNEYLKNN